MSRSQSTVERDHDPVSGGELPTGALTPGTRTLAGGSEEDRLRVVHVSDHSPGDEAPPIGDQQLVLVTASGFEVVLVTSPRQAAWLLRSSGETGAANQHGDRDPGAPRCRTVRRPRPVSVGQLLSQSRLVSRFESPLGGGAA